jgi:hypothetical protein
MKGWNAVLLLSGSTEHLSGATTGGRDRNCKRKLMHFAWYPKHSIFMNPNLTELHAFNLFVSAKPEKACITETR